MAILHIEIYPSQILRKKAEEIRKIDDEIVKLSKDMLETMYKAKGIGLAAPQVGNSKRIIVVDVRKDEKDESNPIVLVNPKIVEASGSITFKEGCLSIPGYTDEVKRYREILVKGFDLDGKELEFEASDLFSVVFQHEIDHLDGILFIDRLGPLKRDIFKRKYKKMREAYEEDRS